MALNLPNKRPGNSLSFPFGSGTEDPVKIPMRRPDGLPPVAGPDKDGFIDARQALPKTTSTATAPDPAQTATAKADYYQTRLQQPMDELRSQAFGGPLPPKQMRFGEARPLLGGTQFKNLQPRLPSATDPVQPRMIGAPGTRLTGPGTTPGLPGAGSAVAGTGNVGPSTGLPRPEMAGRGGFTNYFDEQTGGSPRVARAMRGKPGLRFTEGPQRGLTSDQAKLKLRDAYANLPPEEKAKYEAKAREEDISSPTRYKGTANANTGTGSGDEVITNDPLPEDALKIDFKPVDRLALRPSLAGRTNLPRMMA